MRTKTKTKTKAGRCDWPPAWARLPDSIEEIEAGRVVQGELFPAVPDDGRAAKLQRLLADVPGVMTADKVPTGVPQGDRGLNLYNGTRPFRASRLAHFLSTPDDFFEV